MTMKKRLSKKANWFKKNSFTDEDELYVGVDVHRAVSRSDMA